MAASGLAAMAHNLVQFGGRQPAGRAECILAETGLDLLVSLGGAALVLLAPSASRHFIRVVFGIPRRCIVIRNLIALVHLLDGLGFQLLDLVAIIGRALIVCFLDVIECFVDLLHLLAVIGGF